MQPSLFDAGDEPAPAPRPRYAAEPWLVEELVRLGVERTTAEGYSMRQAFAVKAKLARAGGKPSPAGKPRDLPPPLSEEFTRRPVPNPLRDVAAGELERFLAEFERGEATEEELMRFVRGSCYPLDSAELVRVGRGLILLLRGET
jgi:hypothetical protein